MECGLLWFGDPLALESLDSERRRLVFAYHHALISGDARDWTVAPLSYRSLWSWTLGLVKRWKGLTRFLVRGEVAALVRWRK